MTLRLPDDLDERLAQLAQAQGVSKQQLLVQAAREYVDRESRITRTGWVSAATPPGLAVSSGSSAATVPAPVSTAP